MRLRLYNLLETRWTFLNFFALLGVLLESMWIGYVTLIEWPYNIPFWKAVILARASLYPVAYARDHAIIQIGLVLVIWSIVALEGRGKPLETLLRGKYGFFYCTVCGLFVACIHEIAWYIVDTIVYGFSYLMLPPFNGSHYLDLSIVILPIYFWMNGFRKRDLYFIGFVAIVYILWASIGFPITLNAYGETVWYNSLFVNGVEDLSWISVDIAYLIVGLRHIRKHPDFLKSEIQRNFLR